MSLTAMELYEQLKILTGKAMELTREGNLKELGPTLSRIEATYADLKKADRSLSAMHQAAGKSGEESALSVRVIMYAENTSVLAAEAHLVAAEKALKARNEKTAREVYHLIRPGQDLRKYIEAQRHKDYDLNARLLALDKKLKEK